MSDIEGKTSLLGRQSRLRYAIDHDEPRLSGGDLSDAKIGSGVASDLEVSIVRDSFNAQSDAERRRSVIDMMEISDEEKKRLKELQHVEEEKAATSVFDVLLDIAVFLLNFLILASTATIEGIAVGAKSGDYILRMTFVCTHLISTLFLASLALIIYGPRATTQMFEFRLLKDNIPFMTFSCLNDVSSVIIQRQLRGPLSKLLSQTKLIFTVFVSRFMFKQNVSLSQWTTCFTIFFGLLAYTISSAKDSIVITSWVAIGFSVFISIAAIAGSIDNAKRMKAHGGAFLIVLAGNRMCGFLISVIFCICETTYHGQWHLFPFKGFTPMLVLFSFLNAAKAWGIMAVIFRLDSLFKSLGDVSSVVGWYCMACLFDTRVQFNLLQFICLLGISTNVLGYTFVRVSDAKLYDAEIRLEQIKTGKD